MAGDWEGLSGKFNEDKAEVSRREAVGDDKLMLY